MLCLCGGICGSVWVCVSPYPYPYSLILIFIPRILIILTLVLLFLLFLLFLSLFLLFLSIRTPISTIIPVISIPTIIIRSPALPPARGVDLPLEAAHTARDAHPVPSRLASSGIL